MLIDIPMSCLKTAILIAKKHLLTRKNLLLARVCLVKYLLQTLLEVRQLDVLEKPMRFRTLDLKTKLTLPVPEKLKNSIFEISMIPHI